MIRNALFFCLLLFFSSGTMALERVVFATNWRAQPAHGGFYQALADGTYERYGLDVEIRQGRPSINHRPALLAGKIDILMSANLLTVFDHYKTRSPTVVVAAMFQKDPMAFMVHPDQGYETFTDLVKAPVAYVGKELQFTVWPWLKNEFGFKEEAIRSYNFNLSPFWSNPKSIQECYAIAEPIVTELQGGFKPKVFLMADYGFSTYSTLLEVRRDMAQKQSDYIQRFVDASIIGWANYLYGDRTAANALMKKENPELSDAEMQRAVELIEALGIVNSGQAKTDGIGAMNPERVADFYQKMVRAGLYKADEIDLSKIVNYDFVNKRVGIEISGSQ